MTKPSWPPGWHHPWLVFTDLDGTLLDHDSYSFAAAQGALQRLRSLGMSCVFTTSKTRREVLRLRQTIGNSDPFIVENGGALFVPQAHPLASSLPQAQDIDGLRCLSFGPSRDTILQRLAQAGLDRGFAWRGFSSMPISEIAERTGLPERDARDASWREFCEPVVWLDTPDQQHRFLQALPALGLRALRGGRFLHLLGQEVDKNRAMSALLSACPGKPGAIALGDSDNDADMLQNADIAVLVRAAGREFPQARGRLHTLRTQGYGPAGWNEAMQAILDRLDRNKGVAGDAAFAAQGTK